MIRAFVTIISGSMFAMLVRDHARRVRAWLRRRRHRAAVARAYTDRERLAARRRATIAAWSSSTSDGSRISTRPLTRAELEAPPDGEQSPRWIGDRRRRRTIA